MIQSTHQDKNIMLTFISNEPNEDKYCSEATKLHDDNIQNKKRSITKKSTKNNIQRNRQKQLTTGKNHLMTSG